MYAVVVAVAVRGSSLPTVPFYSCFAPAVSTVADSPRSFLSYCLAVAGLATLMLLSSKWPSNEILDSTFGAENRGCMSSVQC